MSKIKCPIGGRFKCSDEYVDSGQLQHHFWFDHNENEYGKYLAEKIFKIHEKIESHKKGIIHPVDLDFKHTHFEDPNDFPKICLACLAGQEMLEELKSLLEKK